MRLCPGVQAVARARAGRQQLAEDRPVQLSDRHRGSRGGEHLAPMRRLPQEAQPARLSERGRRVPKDFRAELQQHRGPESEWLQETDGQHLPEPGKALQQANLPRPGFVLPGDGPVTQGDRPRLSRA